MQAWDPAPDLSPSDRTSLRTRGGRTIPPATMAGYVWMGSAGIATRLHYDASHNVYAQLSGRKRFWLLPPNATRLLSVYPIDHAHNRQSRLNWDPRQVPALGNHSNLELIQLAQITTVVKVDLDPGEALHLPAGWWHFVQAVTPSISVNMWKESAATVLLHQLLGNLVPFGDSSWPEDKLKIALQHYVPWVMTTVIKLTITDETERHAQHAWTPPLLHSWLHGWYPDIRVHDADKSHLCSSAKAKGIDQLLTPFVDDVSRTFARMADVQIREVMLTIWMHSTLHLLYAEESKRVRFVLACGSPFE
eukprot:TRINITY_DN8015_c0_g1_i1.p1 TRINITY_DN8015_c0_g1~~TRINITY_DN8015_c0_g1_i1.p1  ORF type:complete len:305 (+),score=55.06 TRINITY_DN8015_c0_g1_i1:483-1397(+)